MANCRLCLIDDYPFDLNKGTNLMTLHYTCFTDAHSASQLEIATHGFRYLSDGNQKRMVMIIVNDRLQENEEEMVLRVPMTIYNYFGRQEGKKVGVSREPIGLTQPLMPDLSASKSVNVYFHSSFTVDPAIISFLTNGNFICQTGQYFIDCKWLESSLQRFRSLKERLQFQRAISEQKAGRHRTYLRVFLEVEERTAEAMVFQKGKSALNVKKSDLHPYNLFQEVLLSSLELRIFAQREYCDTLEQIFKRKELKNELIILQTQNNIGISSFLHRMTNHSLQADFKCIDCQTFISTKNFWEEVQGVSSLQDSVILVRNLPWVSELYQAENVIGFGIKEIVSKLEEEFRQLGLRSLRKHCLVVQATGEESLGQFMLFPREVRLILPKTIKLLIFQLIVAQYAQKDHPLRQIIPQNFHDKLGWETFFNFMREQWATVSLMPQSDILKQLRGLSRQEQAENLMQVSWDDVGGLQNAKQEIIQTVLLPIRHPQIFDERIRPRTGLLFYGPPGTGKTLLGKCVAKECKMSFISVKGPELLNMYVGESEKNVRGVFQRARACSPCIIFMDELDALVPKRGNGADSSQVMDRIVAQLLQQMDIAAASQVFIIGATNRPDLLDPSILRPGRFDKQIYLGITQAPQDRIKIIQAQTRHLTLSQGLNWERVLQKVPKNFTGADFYGLTSKAVMAAAERTIQEYQRGEHIEKICLTESDFIVAAGAVKPSVTESDLARYQQLRKIYS